MSRQSVGLVVRRIQGVLERPAQSLAAGRIEVGGNRDLLPDDEHAAPERQRQLLLVLAHQLRDFRPGDHGRAGSHTVIPG